jgi:hypothetical protein
MTAARFALILTLAACSSETRPAPPKARLDMRVAPTGEDVAGLVRTELASASRAGKQLVVYVGAPWCEPCTRFHDAAAAGLLDDALGNVRLFEFDLDQDVDALHRAGYRSELIPLFALPNPDGTASGKQISGSIKGDGAVAQITTRLQALLVQ